MNYETTHTLYSTYDYNTLNQVVKQSTPDGGTTLFWYDRLGRLVLSQNSKQETGDKYSYTQYDALGRITQVGQCSSINPPTESICRDDANLASWFTAAYGYEQITRTYYDVAQFTSLPSSFTQENLRGRVASVTIDHNGDGNFESATHYSYDVHGNVYSLLQDVPYLASFSSQYKQIEYDYDLVSGKVKEVDYQKDQPDRFAHRYEYDADNRITHVYTSRDGHLWDEDASYFYYDHGPLARVEIGDEQVQGVDYAYTLQGWIKGTNSTILSSANDMGRDGKRNDGTTGSYISSLPNLHASIPEDVASFSLNYFSDHSLDVIDYDPVTSSAWLAAGAYNTSQNLWNGNIQSMVTSIYTEDNGNLVKNPMLYQYKYDQLQRIRQSNSYTDPNLLANNSWASKSAGGYNNGFEYDPNGNITRMTRYASGVAVDDLGYNYISDKNQLEYVTDARTAAYFQGQSPGNYTYDETGNLISDDAEGIDNIEWTAYGKIRRIDFSTSSAKPDMLFLYDPMGNRIAKVVDGGYGLGDLTYCDITWYNRDAQGNVMSTCFQGYKSNETVLYLSDFSIYGSSRLGVKNINERLADITFDSYFSRDLGKKMYELSNHLGNVLTTVSDIKLTADGNTDGVVDSYAAVITSAQDYYPFGSLEPGRTYSSDNYRFGFNGKENDNEVKGTGNQQDYGMRIYDPRLGRFLSADPLIVQEQMYPELSPYQFASNRPIQGIDLDGLEFKDVNGNNTNTDPGLILTAADIAIINQYMNSFTFQDISTQMTPQNYNGSTVPMIPLAPNANTASAQTQYMTKFSIDGSRSSLNNPFYSSMEQSKMSATHISKIIGSGAQMSNAVYNYFVTNAIRYGANAAATPLYGDNSIAATDKISASEKVTTQAQLSSIRMDNSFFEFFNPKESSTGPDGMGITTTEYLGLPNPNPGTFYVKTFPSEQIETITALPTNP